MVIVDSFSKFPVAEVVAFTAFPHVKRALDKVFAMMGLPEEVKSDNGPPFQGQEFREYLENQAIRHRKITPLWPQANGEVERLMSTINRTLRIAVDKGENPERALDQFLGPTGRLLTAPRSVPRLTSYSNEPHGIASQQTQHGYQQSGTM